LKFLGLILRSEYPYLSHRSSLYSWGNSKCIQNLVGIYKGRVQLVELHVCGNIVVQRGLVTQCEDLNWIKLAQDSFSVGFFLYTLKGPSGTI